MTDKPILSICIPTKDRSIYLEHTLREITNDTVFQNTNKIEIVISDNCSDDNTENLCKRYQKKFPDKIVYIRQKEDIKDNNFTEVLKLANGKFAKLNNDYLYYKKGALGEIISLLENSNDNVVYFTNRNFQEPEKQIVKVNNFDEFLSKISYICTWIGGLCVNTSVYKQINTPFRFAELRFCQIDVIVQLMKTGTATIVEKNLMNTITIQKKGGYNIAKVFGENFITVLQTLKKENILSDKIYDKTLKELLLQQINHYHFDYKKEFDFIKGGYLKYLYKYYITKPYFYKPYLKYLYKTRLNKLIQTEKTNDKNIIKIFNIIKISFKRKNKQKTKSNNFVQILRPDTAKFIEAGDYTYGQINAFCDSVFPYKLKIGRFCSIASGVKFIVSSEHDYHTLSTYPFRVMLLKTEKFEAKSKGDIIIKDDVWIGTNAIILSGVTIGQGAIIAAGAVVTKDVPPYAIAGGNPAQIIKYRFEPEIIEKLKKFDYSKLTEEKIQKLGLKLYKEITKENVDNLLNEFEGV